VHVHDDALLLVADGWTRRLAFSFVDRVAQDNYTVAVALSGGSPVVISRLGRRTGELTALLEERLREARTRTAAVHAAAEGGLMAAVRTDAPAVLLAHSLVAQVPHDTDWQRHIAGLLS
jgi:hypothetical protein